MSEHDTGSDWLRPSYESPDVSVPDDSGAMPRGLAAAIAQSSPDGAAMDAGHSSTVDDAASSDDADVVEAVKRIKALRQTIDNIDGAVIHLLAERFKATSEVGVCKAKAGFAPADYKREDYQIQRLQRIAGDSGLDPDIAEMYREFVVTESKKRHKRIADAGGDPGVLDVFA